METKTRPYPATLSLLPQDRPSVGVHVNTNSPSIECLFARIRTPSLQYTPNAVSWVRAYHHLSCASICMGACVFCVTLAFIVPGGLKFFGNNFLTRFEGSIVNAPGVSLFIHMSVSVCVCVCVCGFGGCVRVIGQSLVRGVGEGLGRRVTLSPIFDMRSPPTRSRPPTLGGHARRCSRGARRSGGLRGIADADLPPGTNAAVVAVCSRI